MTVLTARLPVTALKGALEDVVLQVLPLVLEEREERSQDQRTVSLTPNSDGTWELSGTLTPECGELLLTALAAEARRDPANPVDTLLREQPRHDEDEAQGLDPFLQSSADLPRWEQDALNALNLQPGARTTDLSLEQLRAAATDTSDDPRTSAIGDAVLLNEQGFVDDVQLRLPEDR